MQISENVATDKDRAYRRRLAAQGQHQLVVALPRETIALSTSSRNATACAIAARC